LTHPSSFNLINIRGLTNFGCSARNEDAVKVCQPKDRHSVALPEKRFVSPGNRSACVPSSHIHHPK
jgi:hypothetical protein